MTTRKMRQTKVLKRERAKIGTFNKILNATFHQVDFSAEVVNTAYTPKKEYVNVDISKKFTSLAKQLRTYCDWLKSASMTEDSEAYKGESGNSSNKLPKSTIGS